MSRLPPVTAAVLALVAVPSSGEAQSAPQASFQIAATISEGCLVNDTLPDAGSDLGTLGRLDFGTASSLSQATHTASLVSFSGVTLSCTPGLALNMRIDGGLHAAGGTRHLAHNASGATLAYTLFTDAGYQQAIGIDVPVGIDTFTEPNDISLPIHGRLTLPGGRPPGGYTDRLTVTLEW